MDEAAEERLKNFFQTDFENMEINITDDECEEDQNTENKMKNVKNGDNSNTIKREDRSPMGCDVSDDWSEKSFVSTISTTPANRRKSERIKSKSSTTPNKNMTARDVKMLSDPQLLRSILAFQGLAQPEEPGDEELLQNPRLMKALRGFQNTDEEGEESNESFQFIVDTANASTPISHTTIKIEGKPRKRKLANQEEFNYVFKNKMKKPNKTSRSSSVVTSLGLPNKGKLLVKEKTPEDLLDQQTARVQQTAKLDTLLKKNPSRAKACLDNLFQKVG